jgi:hypothetical protein
MGRSKGKPGYQEHGCPGQTLEQLGSGDSLAAQRAGSCFSQQRQVLTAQSSVSWPFVGMFLEEVLRRDTLWFHCFLWKSNTRFSVCEWQVRYAAGGSEVSFLPGKRCPRERKKRDLSCFSEPTVK